MNLKPSAVILTVSMMFAGLPALRAQQADPCAGLQNCAASGDVLAQVAGTTSSSSGNHHHVTLRVSFRNLGRAPLILNYKQGSGEMSDERGEKYIVDWRRDHSVAGIPVATKGKASSQFTLRPGESRMATFRYERYTGKVPAGRVFQPSLVVEEYVLLPSNQLLLEREHPLWFGQIQAGGAGNLGQAVEGLRDLFKKK